MKKIIVGLLFSFMLVPCFAEGWYQAKLKASKNGSEKGKEIYYYYFDDAGKVKRIGNVKTGATTMDIEFSGMAFNLFKKDRQTEDAFIEWCEKKKVEYTKVTDLSTLPDWAND